MTDDFKQKPDLKALRISRDDPVKERSSAKYLKPILWILIPVAVIVIVLIILGGLSPSIEVRTAVAISLTQTQAQSVLSATGYVVAQRQAAVASKATGRLEYLAVEEGDQVKKGQIIGRLENDDVKAELDLAKANLIQARAESTEAALNYSRQEKLITSGFISRAEFEASEARYKSLCALVKSAEAAVRAAEVALDNTYIRAPFDGTVLIKHADVGEIVAPMASSASSKGAIVDLADMSSLEVEADVSESNIQRVEVAQPCEILLDAYPEKKYRGYVKKIVPTADRSKATVMTKITFEKIDKFVLPEMSARVNFFPTGQEQSTESSSRGIAVPNSALVMKGNNQIVFIVDDNKALEVNISKGQNLGDRTEIIEGIKAGQRVILSPPSNLKNGAKVKLID